MSQRQKQNNLASLTDFFAGETMTAGKWRDTKLPGFKLKITSGGKKVWIAENMISGTRTSITYTLGKYPELNAKDARQRASFVLDRMRQGYDPRLDKRELINNQESSRRIAQELEKLTLQFVLDDYLARKRLGPCTISNYKCVVSAYLSDWKSRNLLDIAKDDIEKRFHQISSKRIGRKRLGGIGAANNAMRVVRALYNFANLVYENDNKKLITFNPVDRLTELNLWHELKPRRGRIADEDLCVWYQIWCKLDSRVLADYLMFIMLTGLRKEEAARLKWENVYGRQRRFEVLNTKNPVDHVLPITSRLREIFDRRALYRSDLTNPYVFQNLFGIKQELDVRDTDLEIFKSEGQVKFTLHDLRRTYLSKGLKSGYDLSMLKRLANHKSKKAHDVTEGYLIVDPMDLLEPMEKVGDKLWELMTTPVEFLTPSCEDYFTQTR
ncbi:MAG TPA: tyrosine-type recombinase/integrase [Drouetiella sp.]